MKNLYVLSIILLSTTAFTTACAKDIDNKPDTVYRETIGNPALGGPTSLGETTEPISSDLGTTTDLFSGAEKQNAKPAAKNASDEAIVNKQYDELLTRELANPDTQTGLTVPAQQKSNLIRAPRIPVDKVQITPLSSGPIQSNSQNKQWIKAPYAADSAKLETITQNGEKLNINKAQPVNIAKDNSENAQPANTYAVTNPTNPASEDQEDIEYKIEAKDGKINRMPEPVVVENIKKETVNSKDLENAKEQPDAGQNESEDLIQEPKKQAADETKKTTLRMPGSLVFKNRADDSNQITKTEEAEKPQEVVKEKRNYNLVSRFFKNRKTEPKIPQEVAKTEPNINTNSTSELPPVTEANVGQCMSKATIFGDYKEVEEKVQIKDVSQQIIKVPAEYKTIDEEVVLKPEHVEEVVTPAVYKYVEEKIQVHPAQKIWKKEDGSGIMKLVEEPEEFRTEKNKVLIKPEQKESKFIPAVTKKVTKQVLVSEAVTKTVEVPAQYKTVKKRIATKPDVVQWMPVLCKDSTDKNIVKRIQGALIAKGYDVKTADGSLGKKTLNAVDQYQQTIGFKTEGVALKTLDALGIKDEK